MKLRLIIRIDIIYSKHPKWIPQPKTHIWYVRSCVFTASVEVQEAQAEMRRAAEAAEKLFLRAKGFWAVFLRILWFLAFKEAFWFLDYLDWWFLWGCFASILYQKDEGFWKSMVFWVPCGGCEPLWFGSSSLSRAWLAGALAFLWKAHVTQKS